MIASPGDKNDLALGDKGVKGAKVLRKAKGTRGVRGERTNGMQKMMSMMKIISNDQLMFFKKQFLTHRKHTKFYAWSKMNHSHSE